MPVPIVLIGLAIVLLYTRPVQNYLIKKAEQWVEENSEYRLSIGSFRLSFPLTIKANDFIFTNRENNEEIVNGKQLGVSISLGTLLRGDFEVNYITIDETVLHTGNLIDGVKIDGNIGHFRITARDIKPKEEIAEVRHLHLSDSDVKVSLTGGDEKEESEASDIDWIIKLRKGDIENSVVSIIVPADTMNITAKLERFSIRNATADLGQNAYNLKQLTLTDADFTYDTGSANDSLTPLDHLRFGNINIETGEIDYNLPTLKAEVKEITLQQPDGLSIEEMYLHATADSNNINIGNLHLRSKNGTLFDGRTSVPWKMINGKRGGNMRGELSLHIDKRDLKGFITAEQYLQLKEFPDSLLNLQALFNGNLQKIEIDTIYAGIPYTAYIGSRGTLNDITNNKKRTADISFKGALSDIYRTINSEKRPDSILRQQLYLDGNISLAGNDLSGNTRVWSQGCNAEATFLYNLANNVYNARMKVDSMDIAKALPSAPLHALSMKLDLQGEGTDIFSRLTRYECKLNIDSIHYDKYSLQNIDIVAEQSDGKIGLSLNSNDKNLLMQLSADAMLDTATIDGTMQLDVHRADIAGIGENEMPLTAQMSIYAKGFSNMKETHRLQITGDNFKLITKERTFTPARMEFDGMTSPDTSYIVMNTGDLHIKGSMESGYEGLADAVERIERMYKKARSNENMVYFVQDYEKELPAFSIEADCGQKNILANYMIFNNIIFNSFTVHCSMDSINGINANCGLYGLRNEEMMLDTIRVFANQNGNKIRYFAGVRTTGFDPSKVKLTFSASLFGNIENDSVKTNFVFRNNKEHPTVRFKLNTHLMPEGLNFHFDPEAILFGNPFAFNKDNYLNVRKNLALQGNIEFTNKKDAGIHLYTTPDTTQLQNVMLSLFNVDLYSITSMLPFVPEMAGIMNADIHYRNGKKGVLVVGDIQGNDISYEGTMLGNETVELTYIPNGKERHYLDIAAYHNDNEIVNLSGNYVEGKQESSFDGEMTLMRFPLKLSEAFLKESGLSLTGYIDGKISINGPLDGVNTDGFIRFDSVYADAPMFGTRLHLKNDKVNINDNKLLFENFDIYATGQTPFKVNGSIDVQNLSNPAFNLKMQANNYELINTQRKKGVMFYGRMLLDANAFINGTLNSMNMHGNATLLGKTNITYVLQDTPLATDNEFDGLVEFVNFEDTTKVATKEKDVDFGNLNMNITLKVEEGARINADIDENRNSYIELQGEGLLNLTYTNESGMNLTGRYTLSNGQMKYSLPVIPLKTFSINDGSYINWTGDIMNPEINITAIERMNSAVTFEDGNSQAVAFDVGVVLTNRLNNMGLSFTLSAPENATVQNELNSVDKETLNKYAVTMLITGTYIGDNGSLTVSNALSSFLDAKINDLAGNAMKSVNINVGITDVENAETGGTYKNYSFSFSKRFWNDRLTVVIGGEVNSGEHNQNDDSFINNVSLEWKVSNSGNRYIRLFYDKNYESILEGEIIETGIGYVYKRKMNNLYELLIFRKKDNEENNGLSTE